jgi:hypothetical protein
MPNLALKLIFCDRACRDVPGSKSLGAKILGQDNATNSPDRLPELLERLVEKLFESVLGLVLIWKFAQRELLLLSELPQ